MPVRVVKNTMSPSLGKMVVKLDKLPNEAYQKFKQVTPIDTGNAKRRTRLQGSKIKANYPYAVRLDDGYSKQAPQGMWEPTRQHIERLLKNKIMRK